MATAPAPANLPLFYKDLAPLSATQHKDWKIQTQDKAPFLAGQHAVPVTIDEFVVASRFYPVVFSVGEQPLPLALMGLNEGVNVFFDEEGNLLDEELYIPAYVRRYPFLLARLRPDSQELSLCMDPTADVIGAFEEGDALFENGELSEATQAILKFNEQFEEAGLRTAAFMNELKELDLLMDGELAIQPEGAQQPFVYRGFKMVDEKKLNDLRGDQLRKMVQSGMLPLIYAHLFSLGVARLIFARQVRQGKVQLQPVQTAPVA